jgi:hypothetical protein
VALVVTSAEVLYVCNKGPMASGGYSKNPAHQEAIQRTPADIVRWSRLQIVPITEGKRI